METLFTVVYIEEKDEIQILFDDSVNEKLTDEDRTVISEHVNAVVSTVGNRMKALEN
ncbi:hypothetical protein [Paenibacillus sp. MMO-177]|uniref:hypothetical protein n=1 Tax=Paenibacillus sp. MMO-177 TaxID=3081289 RepID=UPI00301B1B2B